MPIKPGAAANAKTSKTNFVLEIPRLRVSSGFIFYFYPLTRGGRKEPLFVPYFMGSVCGCFYVYCMSLCVFMYIFMSLKLVTCHISRLLHFRLVYNLGVLKPPGVSHWSNRFKTFEYFWTVLFLFSFQFLFCCERPFQGSHSFSFVFVFLCFVFLFSVNGHFRSIKVIGIRIVDR